MDPEPFTLILVDDHFPAITIQLTPDATLFDNPDDLTLLYGARVVVRIHGRDNALVYTAMNGLGPLLREEMEQIIKKGQS